MKTIESALTLTLRVAFSIAWTMATVVVRFFKLTLTQYALLHQSKVGPRRRLAAEAGHATRRRRRHRVEKQLLQTRQVDGEFSVID